MTVIEATYRIVTPMFCAGAKQEEAELRLSSFKGALRFWWRSLMWGKVRDCHELREREAELFGASDQRFGQSKVQLRFLQRNIDKISKPPEVFENGQLVGAHYLAYGVMEAFASARKGTKAGQLTRAMIASGTFTIECRLGPHADDARASELEQALIFIGSVGGLGSKSRKGLGSLTITRLKRDGREIQVDPDPSERVRKALGPITEGLPDWSAWSTSSRLVRVETPGGKRPVELLDLLGRELVHFRSWGKNAKVLGIPAERNFPHDHDLWKSGGEAGQYPYRAAFGLPHNYGKGPKNQVTPQHHERRASPLFIHIDQAGDRSDPVAILAFLPAAFLPEGESLKAFGHHAHIQWSGEFWFPIHAYLDRLVSDGSRPRHRPGYDRFPAGKQWWKKQTELTAKEVSLV